MPNVTLHVTPQDSNLLDVDQSGNGNQIAHGPKITITWHLNVPGNQQGSFNAISTDPDTSGFSWVQQPGSGIFGDAQLADNGKKVTITDTNNSSNSTGDWIYQLRATVNGTAYSTTATLPNRKNATANPTIQNR